MMPILSRSSCLSCPYTVCAELKIPKHTFQWKPPAVTCFLLVWGCLCLPQYTFHSDPFFLFFILSMECVVCCLQSAFFQCLWQYMYVSTWCLSCLNLWKKKNPEFVLQDPTRGSRLLLEFFHHLWICQIHKWGSAGHPPEVALLTTAWLKTPFLWHITRCIHILFTCCQYLFSPSFLPFVWLWCPPFLGLASRAVKLCIFTGYDTAWYCVVRLLFSTWRVICYHLLLTRQQSHSFNWISD